MAAAWADFSFARCRRARGLGATLLLGLLTAACAPGEMPLKQEARFEAAPPVQYAQLPTTGAVDALNTVEPGTEPLIGLPADAYDPIEPVNRAIFRFNNVADDYVIRPIANTYETVVPEPIQMNVRNVLRNLRQPVIFANEVLQGDWEGAEVAISRFFLNSTVGLLGLVDIASFDKRLAYRTEDFGQTLGHWGVPEGPYLVLPILGPSTARDTAGIIVDTLADPFRILTGAADVDPAVNYGRAAVTYIDARAETFDGLDELERSSVDFYAAVRSAYRQTRIAAINDADQSAAPLVDIPVYDDFEFEETP